MSRHPVSLGLQGSRRRRANKVVQQPMSPLRHRLDVMAAHAPDAVFSAGGWLSDRAMAGWDVTVYVVELGDARPLNILGARVIPLGNFQMPTVGDRMFSLAVAADLIVSDGIPLDSVVSVLNRNRAEVMFWGASQLPDLGVRVEKVQHRLTTAARAFKATALAAAGLQNETVAMTEDFRLRRSEREVIQTDLTASTASA